MNTGGPQKVTLTFIHSQLPQILTSFTSQISGKLKNKLAATS